MKTSQTPSPFAIFVQLTIDLAFIAGLGFLLVRFLDALLP